MHSQGSSWFIASVKSDKQPGILQWVNIIINCAITKASQVTIVREQIVKRSVILINILFYGINVSLLISLLLIHQTENSRNCRTNMTCVRSVKHILLQNSVDVKNKDFCSCTLNITPYLFHLIPFHQHNCRQSQARKCLPHENSHSLRLPVWLST